MTLFSAGLFEERRSVARVVAWAVAGLPGDLPRAAEPVGRSTAGSGAR
jgi:hypothetical protein